MVANVTVPFTYCFTILIQGDSSKAQPLPSEVTAVQADAGTGCISDKPDECADATMNADTDCNVLYYCLRHFVVELLNYG